MLILGGGPTGLTAAIYAAREGMDALVSDRSALGGQAGVTERIDNYPGFPDGVGGAELAARMEAQARRYGVALLSAVGVQQLRREGDEVLAATTSGDRYRGRAALIATGTSYRRLGVPGEADLIGVGIHFCATCDGPFYRGAEALLVIGGGNSGVEEGLFLAQFAEWIRLVEFMPELGASARLRDIVRSNPKFTIHTNTEVVGFRRAPTGKLASVVARDRATGAETRFRPAAAFEFIGLDPNTAFLRDSLELDPRGFVAGEDHATSMAGVFAAGDARLTGRGLRRQHCREPDTRPVTPFHLVLEREGGRHVQPTIETDALVVGAGEAGALVASLAVDAGASVALAYREPWGSTCLNAGCVPSKFLIHRARVAHVIRTASQYGVTASAPEVDLRGIVAEKRSYLDRHRDESWQGALREERLTLLEGGAEFVSKDRVRVGDRIVRSDRIFIATGMRPTVPDADGLRDGPWFTNETVMDLEEVPEHLIVIGGGYIGCELGQAFRRFGSDVTIVQRPPRLLPGEEPDVSTVLERSLRAEGIHVLTGHELRSVRLTNGRPTVEVAGPDGASGSIAGTHLLLAAGRTPNTDTLALERAGVELDPKGFVAVDDEQRTSAAGIWAIGDVNGYQPFTRVCQEEAKVAFENAFHGAGLRMERASLPHAVFTDPEVGSVGLTEHAAREQGHDVIAGLVPFERVEKAELTGETTGFIKYVAERGTHRLLGCHVVGHQGADLVYDAVVVMRARGRIDDLAMAVGVFPTVQEGMEGAARAVLRKAAPEEVSGPLVTARHGGGGS